MTHQTETINPSPLVARWQWQQRLEAQGFKPLLALFALVCVMCLLYLYQNSTLATATYTIAHLEATRTQLLRRHEQLEAEAAQLESLERVYREASGRLGMVEATEVHYLLVANLPAEEPVVHAFAPGRPAGSTDSTETFFLTDIWQIVVDQFLVWGGLPVRSEVGQVVPAK